MIKVVGPTSQTPPLFNSLFPSTIIFCTVVQKVSKANRVEQMQRIDRDEAVRVIATLLNSWNDEDRIEQLLQECESGGVIQNKPGRRPQNLVKAVYEKSLNNEAEEDDGNDGLIAADELVRKYGKLLAKGENVPDSLKRLYDKFKESGPISKAHIEEEEGIEEMVEEKKRAVKKVKPSRKSNVAEKASDNGMWKPGTKLEAEIMNDDFPHYKDCIHPVEVVKYLPKKEVYVCKMTAFEKEQYEWKPQYLHDPRGADKPKDVQNVHIRIRKRRAGKGKGTLVDGEVSDQGIWVKGKVVKEHNNQQYDVEHYSWKDDDGTKITSVGKEDIRSGYE